MTTPVAQDAATRAREPQHWAARGALGIVCGDLGTSPLYTLQTVVQATGPHAVQKRSVEGDAIN